MVLLCAWLRLTNTDNNRSTNNNTLLQTNRTEMIMYRIHVVVFIRTYTHDDDDDDSFLWMVRWFIHWFLVLVYCVYTVCAQWIALSPSLALDLSFSFLLLFSLLLLLLLLLCVVFVLYKYKPRQWWGECMSVCVLVFVFERYEKLMRESMWFPYSQSIFTRRSGYALFYYFVLFWFWFVVSVFFFYRYAICVVLCFLLLLLLLV